MRNIVDICERSILQNFGLRCTDRQYSFSSVLFFKLLGNRKNVIKRETREILCLRFKFKSVTTVGEKLLEIWHFLFFSAVLLLASDADITVKFYTTNLTSQSIKVHFPRIYGITSSSHIFFFFLQQSQEKELFLTHFFFFCIWLL